MVAWGAAVAALLVVAWFLIEWRVVFARLWAARRLPGPPTPPGWTGFFLGHTPIILAHPGKFYLLLDEYAKTYGGVYVIRFLWSAVVGAAALVCCTLAPRLSPHHTTGGPPSHPPLRSRQVVCADPGLFGPLLRAGPQKLEKYRVRGGRGIV